MRVLMLAALLLATMPVAAQNWVKAAENDNAFYYIDTGTIRVNGHLRRVWALTDLKQRGSSGEMSRRVLHEHDCKEGRARILSISGHSDPMARGRTISTSSEPFPWDYIAPGTVAEAFLKIVCAVRQ